MLKAKLYVNKNLANNIQAKWPIFTLSVLMRVESLNDWSLEGSLISVSFHIFGGCTSSGTLVFTPSELLESPFYQLHPLYLVCISSQEMEVKDKITDLYRCLRCNSNSRGNQWMAFKCAHQTETINCRQDFDSIIISRNSQQVPSFIESNTWTCLWIKEIRK